MVLYLFASIVEIQFISTVLFINYSSVDIQMLQLFAIFMTYIPPHS